MQRDRSGGKKIQRRNNIATEGKGREGGNLWMRKKKREKYQSSHFTALALEKVPGPHGAHVDVPGGK